MRCTQHYPLIVKSYLSDSGMSCSSNAVTPAPPRPGKPSMILS